MTKSWSLDKVVDQTGRVAVVTGANAGLGYETAKVLAGKGAQVVMACRNRSKADEARARLLRELPAADVKVRDIDTASLASVHAFAEAFLRDYQRLDMLINNAGIMITPYFKTEDGFEGQLGVNYLGHFLLTGLLLPLIKQTPKARIVSLYSLAANWDGINWDDVHFSKKYDAKKSYAQSKLACLMFGLELDKRLKEASIDATSMAAHPGYAKSDLSRHLSGWIQFFISIMGPFVLQSTTDGALPSLYACLGEDLRGGEAIGPGNKKETKGPPRVVKPNGNALDGTQRERLWQLSEELCGFSFQF